MDTEINLKHLLQESIRNIPKIIALAIVLALLLGLYAVNNTKANFEAQKFGAQGLLLIEEMPDISVALTKEYQPDKTSLSGNNRAILTSDAVIEAALADPALADSGLSVKDVRSMIYMVADDYSKAMDIQIVGKNQEIVTILCSKILEYGEKHFEELGYKASVVQDAVEKGSVAITVNRDTSTPKTYIDPANGPGSVVTSFIKYGLVGFVGGLCMGIFLVCILFIFRSRIIYKEQLTDNCGVEYLGTSEDDNILWNMYSNAFVENAEAKAVGFMALNKPKGYGSFVERFVDFVSTADKKVLLIDYVKKPLAKVTTTQKGGYTYVEINDELLFKNNDISAAIELLKERHDVTVFKLNDMSEAPMTGSIIRYAENVIGVLEKNKVKTDDLCSIKTAIDKAGSKVIGAVFIKKVK